MIHVALVDPEIHWNTGNAGRSCLAAGAQLHLVGRLGFSLADRRVRRAGLDYWPHVRPGRWASWEEFETALPGLGEPYLFTVDAGRCYWDVTYPDPVTLVFGCESVGLPVTLRERNADRLVRIPMMTAGIRSLNLSTAVGLALYEVLRQRRAVGAPTQPLRPPAAT